MTQKVKRYFNIYDCGGNLLDQLDVMYQRAFMATQKDKYYNALLDTLVKHNNLRGEPFRLSKIGGDNVIDDDAKNAIRKLLHANIDVHSRILIAEFPKYGIKFIEKLQSHCANLTFSEKSRYDRTFQQVTHKGGESAINYIKTFQNAQALSVSVGNSYSEDQIMHIFLDKFPQCGKYSVHIASYQEELRREETFTDQKSLNILSL